MEAPQEALARQVSPDGESAKSETPGRCPQELLPGMLEAGLPKKLVLDLTLSKEEQCMTADTAGVMDTSKEQEKSKEAARVFNVSYTVRIGGAILSCVAGMVNAVAFYALSTFVSHLTGSMSKVGLGLEDSGEADAGDSVLLVLSFVIGSTLTGILISKDTVHFGMALYDLCLICETALLVSATFTAEDRISRYLAAAACGLQNGMATHWGGAVIRTTHVTGLFTDVGLLVGRLASIFCRKRCGAKFDDFDQAFVEDDISKLSVLFTIATFFLVGVYCGAKFYNSMKEKAFLIPAAITGTIGLMYSVYRVVILHQSFFSDAEMEMVDVPIHLQEEVPHSSASLTGVDVPISSSSFGSVGHSHKHSSQVMCVSREMAAELEQTRHVDLHHQG